MPWRRFVVVGLLGLSLGPAVQAGLFSKKPKETPAQRVSLLVGTLQTDPSEGKRESAAEELRQFDPKQFPEIVPVLMDALQRDAKPGVRAEAAISLSKLRPVSSEIGAALEQALAKDASTRVRIQVRTTLWEYRLAGYHGGKVDAPAPAGPPPGPAPVVKVEPPPTRAEPPVFPEAPTPAPLPPPPMSAPRLTPTPAAIALPLPPGPVTPVKPPLVPTEPPLLETPPLPAPDAGPPLAAPE